MLHYKREFQAHFIEYWEIRVFIKRPKRDSCKQKKLKLSFFPLLALPTFPSSFPDEFWILFNLCSLFAISPSLEFQWRSLSWDLLGSSILHFIDRWHPHFNTYLIEEQKLWTCLEAKNLRFVYARYLYLNKLIGYVDLLDFYEHFPERLSDINAPNCLRL